MARSRLREYTLAAHRSSNLVTQRRSPALRCGGRRGQKRTARIVQGSRVRLSQRALRQRRPIGDHTVLLSRHRNAGDIDNIVKPILDALCHHIYMDDRQVQRLVVQKFEPDAVEICTDFAPAPVMRCRLHLGEIGQTHRVVPRSGPHPMAKSCSLYRKKLETR